jgi:ABC-2 type transport system permease protein
MNRVWDQCQKELDQFRRDRLGVALAFLLPLAALLIIGLAIRLEAKIFPSLCRILTRRI